MFRLLLPLFVFLCCLPQTVHACKVLQDPERAEKDIARAYYIGLVTVYEREIYESGQVKSAHLKPFMMYKSADGFDPKKMIIVNFEDMWTSCDYPPYAIGLNQEVMIFKDEDGGYKMGNQFNIGMGAAKWDQLRENVKYVGGE